MRSVCPELGTSYESTFLCHSTWGIYHLRPKPPSDLRFLDCCTVTEKVCVIHCLTTTVLDHSINYVTAPCDRQKISKFDNFLKISFKSDVALKHVFTKYQSRKIIESVDQQSPRGGKKWYTDKRSAYNVTKSKNRQPMRYFPRYPSKIRRNQHVRVIAAPGPRVVWNPRTSAMPPRVILDLPSWIFVPFWCVNLLFDEFFTRELPLLMLMLFMMDFHLDRSIQFYAAWPNFYRLFAQRIRGKKRVSCD